MRKVFVTVVGTQTDAGGEENRIEFMTEGSRRDRDGTSYITYRESAITGMEGTTTLLKLYPDRLIIVRVGAVDLKQEFFPGLKSHGTYKTPFGSMQIAVSTRRLDIESAGDRDTVTVGYDLEVDGRWQSYNTLVVEIREEV
ncbi:DUF1934 domain-containing protein [Anaeroselena agilis]|uniref:DUF1934 domain-containing protein n=1 Tax=Anaeroselena agilis TaxID=3063788 RepID=A0ABU3P197_9FIRM|nr:DUF1934 domain-containing protein [Selenomonadales bacterium 4137-cl]